MNAKEIIDQLNTSTEVSNIEAKEGGIDSKSIYETISAYANEPGLGGGIIIVGVKEEQPTDALFPQYVAVGVGNPDKVQSEVATNCASVFNVIIRPRIRV